MGDGLLAVLAAFHEFNLLAREIVGFIFEANAKTGDLTRAQGDVNFRHRGVGNELAQRMNEDRCPAQL